MVPCFVLSIAIDMDPCTVQTFYDDNALRIRDKTQLVIDYAEPWRKRSLALTKMAVTEEPGRGEGRKRSPDSI